MIALAQDFVTWIERWEVQRGRSEEKRVGA